MIYFFIMMLNTVQSTDSEIAMKKWSKIAQGWRGINLPILLPLFEDKNLQRPSIQQVKKEPLALITFKPSRRSQGKSAENSAAIQKDKSVQWHIVFNIFLNTVQVANKLREPW